MKSLHEIFQAKVWKFVKNVALKNTTARSYKKLRILNFLNSFHHRVISTQKDTFVKLELVLRLEQLVDNCGQFVQFDLDGERVNHVSHRFKANVDQTQRKMNAFSLAHFRNHLRKVGHERLEFALRHSLLKNSQTLINSRRFIWMASSSSCNLSRNDSSRWISCI